MNRFALVGASYKTAGVELLGRLGLPTERLAERLLEFAKQTGAREIAYIGTCNRVEFVLAGDDAVSVQTCRQKIGELLNTPERDVSRIFRAWEGEGAVEHLFLVAAGLDSAQPGEREIYAQVRRAWGTAKAAGTCGPLLDYLFGEALRSAQDVHRQAIRPANTESLAGLVIKRALAHIDKTDKNIAIVGVSPMTRRCAILLREQGVHINVVNRTFKTAQSFAHEIAGTPWMLDDFKKNPGKYNLVITAVRGAEPVLDRDTLEAMALASPAGGTLIVDLGVPPNVDPMEAEIDGIVRIGMDYIIADATEGRTLKLAEMADARLIVDEHLDRLRRDYAIREAAPMIQRLAELYQTVAAESLQRLPNSTRTALKSDDHLQTWASGLAKRMAHVPLKGLRSLAAESGPAAVQAYLRGVESALSNDGEDKMLRRTETGGKS
ncbi:MAG: hypothetical protein CMG46_10430 [Candidatus Marinimicrobia bacterium]|nr:hypothetical protein [Candidatus Neomarinimicrobiota bacterium]